MATHCSIIVWRIPWTKESGEPQPWGHKESDISLATLAFFWFPFATFSFPSFSACDVFLHLK